MNEEKIAKILQHNLGVADKKSVREIMKLIDRTRTEARKELKKILEEELDPTKSCLRGRHQIENILAKFN